MKKEESRGIKWARIEAPPNHILGWLCCCCFADNQVGDEGAASLGKALQSNTSLHSLNLSCTEKEKRGEEFQVKLAGIIEKNPHSPPARFCIGCGALSLYCADNQVQAIGSVRLGEALQVNPSLTSLQLSCTMIEREREGIEVNLEWEEKSQTTHRTSKVCISIVLSLSCSGNQVGDDGAARLGEALQSNTSLTSLDLRCTEEGRG